MVPPPGYVALGHLVSNSFERPALDAAWCVRADVVRAKFNWSRIAPAAGPAHWSLWSDALKAPGRAVEVFNTDPQLKTFNARGDGQRAADVY
eukprot:9198012-Pyramimonas_sp.AAC.1